ncbi:unnamed protein product [Linum tenue]|uniref:Uncharacterized protein n=1 Tax=Linum tenue TaxID=586396 RepID=A0AAV0MIS5_9ROSI|nr:unnamed protein product [Linum tenue]
MRSATHYRFLARKRRLQLQRLPMRRPPGHQHESRRRRRFQRLRIRRRRRRPPAPRVPRRARGPHPVPRQFQQLHRQDPAQPRLQDQVLLRNRPQQQQVRRRFPPRDPRRPQRLLHRPPVQPILRQSPQPDLPAGSRRPLPQQQRLHRPAPRYRRRHPGAVPHLRQQPILRADS